MTSMEFHSNYAFERLDGDDVRTKDRAELRGDQYRPARDSLQTSAPKAWMHCSSVCMGKSSFAPCRETCFAEWEIALGRRPDESLSFYYRPEWHPQGNVSSR
ncbi:hypothetical protein DIPPA_24303 [Diplonema papillatum]|nr:hypothetical protein DIPPA_24303 [Diplonema papillatum]